jgi:lysophospholipase L1-like esterase
VSIVSGYTLLITQNENNNDTETVRIACIGDSLTQSSGYVYDLWKMLGSSGPFTYDSYTEPPHQNADDGKNRTSYAVGNFGVGGTMVTIKSETPYTNTTAFQDALKYQPNIAIIMLGTNDAQPGVHQYNMSFVGDYKQLISAFQTLESRPRIWIVLPPPIFSSQAGKTSPEYFEQTVIPAIKQAANEANLPIIDAHSALSNYQNYFPDGMHPNSEGAKLMAEEIYNAIFSEQT